MTTLEGVSEPQHRHCKPHSMPGLYYFDKAQSITQDEGSACHRLSKVQAGSLWLSHGNEPSEVPALKVCSGLRWEASSLVTRSDKGGGGLWLQEGGWCSAKMLQRGWDLMW